MIFRKYKCVLCDFIYDEEKGDPDSGLMPGTRFEDIPEKWNCPECGVTKTFLELMDYIIDTSELVLVKSHNGINFN